MRNSGVANLDNSRAPKYTAPDSKYVTLTNRYLDELAKHEKKQYEEFLHHLPGVIASLEPSIKALIESGKNRNPTAKAAGFVCTERQERIHTARSLKGRIPAQFEYLKAQIQDMLAEPRQKWDPSAVPKPELSRKQLMEKEEAVAGDINTARLAAFCEVLKPAASKFSVNDDIEAFMAAMEAAVKAADQAAKHAQPGQDGRKARPADREAALKVIQSLSDRVGNMDDWDWSPQPMPGGPGEIANPDDELLGSGYLLDISSWVGEEEESDAPEK